MSRSPKYSPVRASAERKKQLAEERRARERRRQEDAAAVALEKARERARGKLRLVTDLGPDVLAELRQAIDVAGTAEKLGSISRRLDEVCGLSGHTDERLSALLDELDAKLTSVAAESAAADVALADLVLARAAAELIRAELADGRMGEAELLAAQLSGRVGELENELDTAIEHTSARRDLLGSIVDALPGLGFAVDPGSLTERADGSLGLRARRHGDEDMAVVVENTERYEYRVNYLRGGTSTAVLDPRSCSTLRALAEKLNESVRGTGFDTGTVTWDGRRHLRPHDTGEFRERGGLP
jgi:hypothetical protein